MAVNRISHLLQLERQGDRLLPLLAEDCVRAGLLRQQPLLLLRRLLLGDGRGRVVPAILINRQTDRQPARFGLIDSQPEGTHYLIASGHFPLNTPVPSLPPSCTTRYAFGLVAVIRWSAFVFRESDSERDRASTRAPEFPIKLSERVLS